MAISQYFLRTTHTTADYETLDEARTALKQRIAHEKNLGHEVIPQPDGLRWRAGSVGIWIEDYNGRAVRVNAP